MPRVSEAEYEARALTELDALIEALDALPTDDIDCELSGDILSIEFPNGPAFVINSHRAARQIWMAADRSAFHFDYVIEDGIWLSDKGQAELWSTLAELLSKRLGHRVTLKSS